MRKEKKQEDEQIALFDILFEAFSAIQKERTDDSENQKDSIDPKSK